MTKAPLGKDKKGSMNYWTSSWWWVPSNECQSERRFWVFHHDH